MDIVIACGVAGLWQLVMHWLPWQGLAGTHVSGKPLIAYVIGTVGLMLAFGAGVLRHETVTGIEATAVLVAACVSSGLCTAVAYGIDAAIGWRNEARMRSALDRGVSNA